MGKPQSSVQFMEEHKIDFHSGHADALKKAGLEKIDTVLALSEPELEVLDAKDGTFCIREAVDQIWHAARINLDYLRARAAHRRAEKELGKLASGDEHVDANPPSIRYLMPRQAETRASRIAAASDAPGRSRSTGKKKKNISHVLRKAMTDLGIDVRCCSCETKKAAKTLTPVTLLNTLQDVVVLSRQGGHQPEVQVKAAQHFVQRITKGMEANAEIGELLPQGILKQQMLEMLMEHDYLTPKKIVESDHAACEVWNRNLGTTLRLLKNKIIKFRQSTRKQIGAANSPTPSGLGPTTSGGENSAGAVQPQRIRRRLASTTSDAMNSIIGIVFLVLMFLVFRRFFQNRNKPAQRPSELDAQDPEERMSASHMA